MTSVVSFLFAVLATLLAPLQYLAAARTAFADTQVIERTMTWTATSNPRVLELSNISGSVHIVGENRADVAIKATRTVRREGPSGGSGAAVDFRSSDNRLLVCGDNRHCGCHVSSSRDRWDKDDARVDVDFEVRVPVDVTLDVCTVNNGTLRVENVRGAFALQNVNGAVALDRMGGSGKAITVNGDVTATFSPAPDGPTAFRTINGDIIVTMPASLGADVRLHTMHGEIYTNFETTPLPASTATERRGRRTVIHSGHTRMRVGKGGPELSFDTLNGDIALKKP